MTSSRERGERLADAVFGRTSSSKPHRQAEAASRIRRREAEAEAARWRREQATEQSIKVDAPVTSFDLERRRDEYQREKDERRREKEREERDAELRAERLAYLRAGNPTRRMRTIQESIRAVATFERSSKVIAPGSGIEVGTPAFREFEAFKRQADAAIRTIAKSRLDELRAELKDAEQERADIIARG